MMQIGYLWELQYSPYYDAYSRVAKKPGQQKSRDKS